MTYTRKTKDVFVIQQYWGNQYGWEDVTQEDTRKEARARLKEYRQNQPQAPARLIVRREKIQEVDPLFMGIYPEGIVYSDRTQEEYGDYKRLGFLPYNTLILSLADDCPHDLRVRIEADAEKFKAGEVFNIDRCGSFIILGGAI
jgi:hypothetical protein